MEDDTPRTDLPLLFHELVRLGNELSIAADVRLRADVDLTLARFQSMLVIERLPTCRVLDVAAELGITVGGASKIVDRVEDAGHCRRRANPEDRRSSLVQLTPAGKRVLRKAEKSFEQELAGRLDDVLGPRAMTQFVKALGSLRLTGAAPA